MKIKRHKNIHVDYSWKRDFLRFVQHFIQRHVIQRMQRSERNVGAIPMDKIPKGDRYGGVEEERTQGIQAMWRRK